MGEILTSGIREKMKQIKTQDNVYKALKNFLNKYQGHNKIDFTQLSLEQLQNKRDEITLAYNDCYQKIKERLEKQDIEKE